MINYKGMNLKSEGNAMLDCIIGLFVDIADCFLDMGLNKLIDKFTKKK